MKVGDVVYVKPIATGMVARSKFLRIMKITQNGNFRGMTVPDIYNGRTDILAYQCEVEPIPTELVNEPEEVIKLYFAL